MNRAARALLVALTMLRLLAADASAGQFKPPAYYRAGQRPYRVIATQFTQSGNLDLAVADFVTSQMYILLGNGDGTFQKPLTFSVPAPIAVAAGDFNADGRQDLVVIESGGTGDSLLVVFLGNGDGTFRQAGTGMLGVYSANLAVADFNGDGHLDVAVANRGFDRPGNVMVFVGNGRGDLKERTVYKMSGGPWGIAVGDVNGDHLSDLVVTGDLDGSVAVFLNDGTGKFKKPVMYSAGGGEAIDVKIADLRNDGNQDLVVANGSQGMVVLLNNGDGTFGQPTIYVPACHNCQAPEACVVADFNLDGNLDVACATNIVTSYFFYGKGNGKFGPAIPLKDTIKNQGGFSIAAGDFNNDQAPDLAIPIELKGKVAVMLNTK